MKERFALKNWKRQHTEMLVAVVLLIFLLVPMLVLCFYAGPSADDFTHPAGAGYRWHSFVPNPVAVAIRYAGHKYLTWQGTYFSMFINVLVPFYLGGNIAPVFCLCTLVFFVLALFFAVRTALATVLKCRALAATFWVFLAVLFLAVQFVNASEWFYWISGAVSYTIPAGLLLLGAGAACRAVLGQGKRRVWYAVGAVLCLVCACGGTLVLAAYCCYAFAGVALYLLVRKSKKAPLVVFFAVLCIACTAVNAFAPGGFLRQSAEQGENLASVQTVIIFTLQQLVDILTLRFPLPIAAGVALLLFPLAARTAAQSGFSFALPGLVLPLAWAGLFITLFPFVYATGILYLEYRVISTIAFFSALLTLFSLFYLAGWLCKKYGAFTQGRVTHAFTGAASLMLAVGITIFSPNNWLSLNIVENFAIGTIQAQKAYTDMVLAALEAPGNGAVFVPQQEYFYSHLKSIAIQPDPAYWINQDTALWYGKEAVIVEIPPQ